MEPRLPALHIKYLYLLDHLTCSWFYSEQIDAGEECSAGDGQTGLSFVRTATRMRQKEEGTTQVVLENLILGDMKRAKK